MCVLFFGVATVAKRVRRDRNGERLLFCFFLEAFSSSLGFGSAPQWKRWSFLSVSLSLSLCVFWAALPSCLPSFSVAARCTAEDDGSAVSLGFLSLSLSLWGCATFSFVRRPPTGGLSRPLCFLVPQFGVWALAGPRTDDDYDDEGLTRDTHTHRERERERETETKSWPPSTRTTQGRKRRRHTTTKAPRDASDGAGPARRPRRAAQHTPGP